MHLQLPLMPSKDLALKLLSAFRAILKAWTLAWPLTFPDAHVVIKFWRDHREPCGFRARIRACWGRIRDYAKPRCVKYRSAEDEEEYWRSAERTRRAYEASNANVIPAEVPLVRYYTPKLLPLYRERAPKEPETREYSLSPRAYCKWHRMVFRGPVRSNATAVEAHSLTGRTSMQLHPTYEEAAQQIRLYSSRDRREMRRISGLATDEEVFGGKRAWTMRYAAMWRAWLDTKGPDVSIVFE
ncbi:hypothetical protein BN946_scf184370.g10 [Trametes cinnabarina]|uniref:Uncharacterized protein n=1 Tax=Pycnoporus cinnabarinus TaxID=5643 RepID=A0A060SDJ0_PYCCI|nr:hypothetical protein BN946_scf184370.g10 [Trametes cinnabarina]